MAVVKKALLSNLSTWQIKRMVKEEVLRQSLCPAARAGDKPALDLDGILANSGLGVKLKNSIYRIYRQAHGDRPAAPEGISPSDAYCADQLEYVEKAKLKWEKRIRLELDAMAAEMGVPLQRGKSGAEEPPRPAAEDQAIRFVYDDNDLLDVLSTIACPNRSLPASKVPLGRKGAWGSGLPRIRMHVGWVGLGGWAEH